LTRFIEAFVNNAFVRFVFAGGLNTVFTYALYLLLLLVTPYTVAYAVSYFAGIPLGYVLNARFVFHQPLRWRTAFQFPLVYVVQFSLGMLFTIVFVDGLGIDASIAAALGTLVTVPVTFLLTRFIIKGRRPLPEAETSS
jgi:putative flippase GtrA